MSIVAGVDIGNSTTEIVLTDDAGTPLVWDRAPTRGVKGSPESWKHAARLLKRLERRAGTTADLIAVTPQYGVTTRNFVVAQTDPATWPVVSLGGSGRSPGRTGYGIGRPALLSADVPVGPDPVVALVPDSVSYRKALPQLLDWRSSGVVIAAILVAGDEAVLLANRLDLAVPILDEVNVELAAQSELLACEVADAGHGVRLLCDAVRLAAIFGGVERVRLDRAATLVTGQRAAVFGRFAGPEPAGSTTQPPWVRFAGSPDQVPIAAAVTRPDRREAWYDGERESEVADWSAVDLGAAAAAVWARPDTAGFVVATLGNVPLDQALPVIGDFESGELRILESEPAAGRAGALSTPGAQHDAVVLDLGAGTVDAIGADWSRTLAGAGDLLTLAVGTSLGIPRGAADWVKRGPAARLEGPHVLADENGDRNFLDRPAPADAVGSLVVSGPAGLLPFHRRLALTEWRALRLRLKADTLGENVARALDGRELDELLVVGGPAGDEELLSALRQRLPAVTIGRADVAGRLGHRWAVAYGLTRLAQKR